MEKDRINFVQGTVDDYVENADEINLEENVTFLLENIREYSRTYEDFLNVFPDWKHQREKSISCLTETIEKMNNMNRRVNFVSATSSASSVVSGAISLAKGILDLSSSSLPRSASVLNKLSLFLHAGATGDEIIFSKIYLNEAQKILETDNANFEVMNDFFIRTQRLVAAIKGVGDISVVLDLLGKLTILFSATGELYDMPLRAEELIKQIDAEMKGRISLKIITRIVQVCYSKLELFAQIYVAYSVFRENPHMIPAIISVSRAVKTFTKYLNEPKINFKDANNVSTGKKSLKGALHALRVLTEGYSLYLHGKDIWEGSESDYAPTVKHARDQLRRELHVFSRLHEMLNQMNAQQHQEL